MKLALLMLVFHASPVDSGDLLANSDVIVVCPQPFREALIPWIEHRQDQGHNIVFVDTHLSAAHIKDVIHDRAKSKNIGSIVLVGDAPGSDSDHGNRVPTFLVPAAVNVRYGSEPEIASDNVYADLDDDGLPDVPIGRLPADSGQAVHHIVRKILSYEHNQDMSPWRRRINFIAGTGGFGPILDSVIEMIARRFIADGIPSPYRTTMTYAAWQSAYCPDPRAFRQATIARLNEGSLFWIYLGHGTRHELDRIRVPGGSLAIFEQRDVESLRNPVAPTIALFLSCYAAAFDGDYDCLGEDMLTQSEGPVAIIGGSRVTMPYAMTLLGEALMDEYFSHRHETLGEVLLHAKKQLINYDQNNSHRKLLDSLATSFSLSADALFQERSEHVHMFHLLGDPLLRIPQPYEVKIDVERYAVPGQTMRVDGLCEFEGQALVELVCRRDRMTFKPESRREFVVSHDELSAYNDVYRRANDHRWSVQKVEVRNGQFHVELDIPRDAQGPCHVRVFVRGEKKFGVGAADVLVRIKPETQSDVLAERVPLIAPELTGETIP